MKKTNINITTTYNIDKFYNEYEFTTFINNILGNYCYSEKEKQKIEKIIEKYIFELDSYTNRIKIIEDLSPILIIKERNKKLNKINESTKSKL